MIWRPIGTTLLDAIYGFIARIRAWLPRRLRGADALKGDRGGQTRVRRPRGFAPYRAGGKTRTVVPIHPRAEKVFHNAVIFLFDHLGLGVVPGQFWPFLSATGDPGEALTLFLRAIGCDPERIRSGDRAEREKALEIIDFLVLSGDVLDRLSPKARRILGERLEAGDYTTVREAARIMADLAAALEVEARWRGAELLPSFHRLLTSIRNLANRPLDSRPEHAERAARLARSFSAAQSEYDDLCDRYRRVSAELDSLAGRLSAEHGTVRQTREAFEAARQHLSRDPLLNIEDVEQGVGVMRAQLDILDRLLAQARSRRARTGEGAGRSGGHSGARARSQSDPTLDDALTLFGFSRQHPPTLQELKRKWRAMHAELHRRSPPDKEVRMKHFNVCHDLVRDHLGGFSRAAA
jgi:hypothetical protein